MSVRLSVRLYVCVKRNCEKRKQTYADVLTPQERSFILVFRQEEWLFGDEPFYLKVWVKLTPLERERRFLIDIRS